MMLMLNMAAALTIMVLLGSLIFRFTRAGFDRDELEFIIPVTIILWLLGGLCLGIMLTQHGPIGSIIAWLCFVPWLGCPFCAITHNAEIDE